MGNYGLRISSAGNDVKTCSDLNTTINSKYANLKGALSGEGSVVIAQTVPSPDTPEWTKIITIAHGLGHIPMVNLQADVYNLGGYFQAPIFENGAAYETYALARADATNVYLEFYYLDYFSEDPITINYKYFIYIDKGNLN